MDSNFYYLDILNKTFLDILQIVLAIKFIVNILILLVHTKANITFISEQRVCSVTLHLQ